MCLSIGRQPGIAAAPTPLTGRPSIDRNRFRPCKAAGVPSRFENYKGDNPAKFVTAKNVHRRNLTTNERALIAAKMASLVNGSNQFGRKLKKEGDVETSPSISINEAADLMGVSRDVVVSAKTVIDHGSAIDIAAVSKGDGLLPTDDGACQWRAARQRSEKKFLDKPLAIDSRLSYVCLNLR